MNIKVLARVALGMGIALSTPVIAPALRAQQSSPDEQPVLSARDFQVQRATILMATKRYEEAIQIYETILKSEPKNAALLNMMGIAHLNLTHYDLARKSFERSAKADKKFASPVNNIGMVWYQKKNYRRAIREYRKAIAIDPGQAGTHANLGYAYFNTKKFTEAFAEFHTAIEIDPHALEHNDRVGTMMQDRTVSNHGLFFFMMARTFAELGDAAKCAEYLRKSIDEGYPDVRKANSDPSFKKVVNDPAVQGVLLLLLPESSQATQ